MTAHDSLIGRQIDQFRVDEFIASGAMGTVFKAYDTVLHRTVALKLISKEAESSPTMDEARRRLVQEAMAAGRLCHPNIVTIHCYGETADFQYICMEYVMGSTLGELLDQKKVLDIEEAVDIFQQVLLALEAANQEHIVHRDIKPSNIMITADNRVKVMDFGIAKLPSLSVTTTGTVLGTPFYMSPEQISGQKVDIRSDIFSVGAVFYQVLTGQKPFDAESTVTLAYKIVQVEPIPPKVLNIYIPHSLEAICKKALAKDPVLRYQTPAEMLKVLKDLKEKGCAASSASDATIKTKDLMWEKTIQIKRPEAARGSAPAMPPTPSESRLSSSPASASEADDKKTLESSKRDAQAAVAPQKEKDREEEQEPAPPPSLQQQPEPEKTEDSKEGKSPAPTPPPSAKPATAQKGAAAAKPEVAMKKKGTSGTTLGILVTLLLAVIGAVVFTRFWRTSPSQQVTQPTLVTPSPPATPPPAANPQQTAAPPAAPATQPTPQEATPAPQSPVSSVPVPAPPSANQIQTNNDQLQKQVDTLLAQAKNQMDSDPAAAQNLLQQALTLDPNNPEAIMQLARLLTFRKDFQKAINYYESALQLNLKAPEIYFNLGYIYLTQGNYRLAIQNYENCLRLSPPFADEVLTNLAICHIKTNNFAQAQSLLKKALQLNPNNELAQYYLRTIGSG